MKKRRVDVDRWGWCRVKDNMNNTNNKSSWRAEVDVVGDGTASLEDGMMPKLQDLDRGR